jgi:ATP-binding cassette, subfamily B (MDR/TAP), member 1
MMREDIERDPLIDRTTSSGLCLSHAKGGFEFKDVSFTYPSRLEVTVLDYINISIPPNKHTAIVGLSRSDKSTIAGLITRLYDPTLVHVLLDGHDLRDLNVRNSRSFLSLVQQEPSTALCWRISHMA